MAIMTVLGPMDPGSLGITLVHEHLFIDLRNQFVEFDTPEKARISREPITLSNYGIVRRNPYAIRDNLVLDDQALALQEVARFRASGGESIVDCTSVGIAPAPQRLRELAIQSGVSIIAGCGYYTYDTHPLYISQSSVEQIADRVLGALEQGIEGSDVRAGVIGELGTSFPIHPQERKVLCAAALAFQHIHAPIYVHTYPWAQAGIQAADILLERGVDPAKIVICHVDVDLQLPYLRSLLERGVFVEFDDFGKEFYIDIADRHFAGGVFAHDIERVRTICQLLDWGFGEQILVTNDICLKSMLHAYGGWGYDHILEHVVPMMQEKGIPQEQIDTFLVTNPKRLLDI
jgi:phosphotriesterase-related protein